MSELSNVTRDTANANKGPTGTTEQKTGRRWVRCALWGIAIIVAVFLIAGTIAAIFWCG